MKTEEMSGCDTCKLCGTPDLDLKYDHLRPCYKSRSTGQLSPVLYQPRLTGEELSKLQAGFNDICSNRAKCRKRQG